jgi:hypothetical protein
MFFRSLKISIFSQKPILNLGNFTSAQNNLGPTRAFGALLEISGTFQKLIPGTLLKQGYRETGKQPKVKKYLKYSIK